MTADEGVQIHVAIKIDMEKMATWTPDRICAFFSGLAQVVPIKNKATPTPVAEKEG